MKIQVTLATITIVKSALLQMFRSHSHLYFFVGKIIVPIIILLIDISVVKLSGLHWVLIRLSIIESHYLAVLEYLLPLEWIFQLVLCLYAHRIRIWTFQEIFYRLRNNPSSSSTCFMSTWQAPSHIGNVLNIVQQRKQRSIVGAQYLILYYTYVVTSIHIILFKFHS